MASWRSFVVAITLLAGLSAFGCRTPGPADLSNPAVADVAQLADRLAALRSAISDDHRRLEILIAKTERAEDGALYQDPEMSEIATRLIESKRSLRELIANAPSESAPSK